MLSVRQYHRLHYYITEKIFFCILTFDDAPPCKQRNCRSSFFVLYGARARKKRMREDDPQPCDRRGKTLFFASDDKYVAKCAPGPEYAAIILAALADPFVKLTLPHFLPCTDYYNTLRITRSLARSVSALGWSRGCAKFSELRFKTD